MKSRRGDGFGVHIEKHMIGIDTTDHEQHVSDPAKRTQIVIEVDPKVAELIVKQATKTGFTVEDMAAIYMTFATAAFEVENEKFHLINIIVGETVHKLNLPIR